MKKKKSYLIIFLFLLVSSAAYCQNNIEKTFMALREYNLPQAKLSLDDIGNNEIRKLFTLQIKYYETGILDSLEIDATSNTESDIRTTAIKNILIGDYHYLNKDPSKNQVIFNRYFNTIETARELKDTFLLKEALRKMNSQILYRARDTLSTEHYLKLYESLSKGSKLDIFWHNYISIGYQFMLTEKDIKSANPNHMAILFEKAFSAVDKGSFLTGMLYQIKGIYQSHWLKNFKKANINNIKAKEIYERIPFWFAQNKLKGLEYNTHINYHKSGQHRKAIPFFRKDLKRNKEPLLVMHTNEWLFKCYEGLQQYDSAHFYFKEMVKIKEQMKQSENAINIKKFSTKYDFEKKEKELAQLADEKSKLQKNFYTILPILGVLSAILLITFFLYKRYKKRSTTLETEKSETLQKLDELKNIVIKNHIILKDKTKVYISDLMYIKSDDHYLNIYTSDDKSHFVRGKLSKIREELPPNFIQCHRSYIVNSNFIKRINTDSIILIDKTNIPLSRSYRNKF